MIKLNDKNGIVIELYQERQNQDITVDISKYGELDYWFNIKAEDFIAMINKYQADNNII